MSREPRVERAAAPDMAGGVLVAGIGNIFCSDDGFGPAVATRLLTGQAGVAMPPEVTVVDYGIRGMHLAYDLLDGVDLLVLVDALPDRGNVGQVVVLEIGSDDVGAGAATGGEPAGSAVDAHGMDPTSVLTSLRALGGTMPRTILVGCEVADVDEGMGLSPAVENAVGEAAGTVAAVLAREPEVA